MANTNLVGVHYITVGSDIVLLKPGQEIPQGWRLADGQNSALMSDIHNWREIVLDKPRTVFLGISQIVKKVEAGQTITIWKQSREVGVTAIQIPMPSLITKGVARTFCLTLGYMGTFTYGIEDTVEVVLK